MAALDQLLPHLKPDASSLFLFRDFVQAAYKKRHKITARTSSSRFFSIESVKVLAEFLLPGWLFESLPKSAGHSRTKQALIQNAIAEAFGFEFMQLLIADSTAIYSDTANAPHRNNIK